MGHNVFQLNNSLAASLGPSAKAREEARFKAQADGLDPTEDQVRRRGLV